MLRLLLAMCLLLSPSIGAAQDSHYTADAARGYSYLLNGGYIGCGIPVEVMKRALSAQKIFGAKDTEEIFFSSTRLPGRVGENASVTPDMTVFTSKRGVKVINYNCLSCHGEYLNGNFVVGLGNRTRDYTANLADETKLLPFLAWSLKEQAEVKVLKRGMETIAPYVRLDTVGVNPALNLTWTLFGRRSPEDFTWTKDFILEPLSKHPPPVDVPPWWRMGKKSSMFYNGEFRDNHHRIMSLAPILCLESADEMRALDDPFRDVESFIKAMKAPRYPLPVKEELLAQGKEIFEATCSRCHGAYGEEGFYPDLIVPLETVGTDSLLAEQANHGTDRFYDWITTAYFNVYNTSMTIRPEMGYIAPPLDGVWATAPFLHNGSIPSLEAVLDSSKRPKYWLKSDVLGGGDYDLQSIAVRHRALTYGQDKAKKDEKPYIYDTTRSGYGNAGHTFGDHLTDDERRAVMEYLKTL